MINFLLKKFRSLTISSQVIIFNIGIITLMMVIIISTYYIQSQIILNITIESSKVIMITEDKHQITNLAKYVQASIEYKHQSVIHQIKSVAMFNQFYQENQKNIQLHQEVQPCLTTAEFQISYFLASIPRFCYQTNDSTTLPNYDTNVRKIHQAISLIDSYSLTIDNFKKGVLQVGAISNSKYFDQFPFGLIIPTYDITQRQWFINHLKNTNQNKPLVFTTLYKYFQIGQLEIAASYSLFEEDLQTLIGIVKQSLSISGTLIPSAEYNLMMFNEQGAVVLFQTEQFINLTDALFVYNEELTGFNMTDWQKMIMASKNSLNSNLVLVHKLFNQTVNMNVQQLKSNNFTIIIYSNISKIDSFEQQFGQFISQTMMQWTITALGNLGIESIGIVIQILIITLMFHPFHTLTYIVLYHSLSQGNKVNSEIFKFANRSYKHDSISELQNKMLDLTDDLSKSQFKKCSVCKDQESVQYPTKLESLKGNNRVIKSKIKYFRNQVPQPLDFRTLFGYQKLGSEQVHNC